jgi:hypothetical protein
MECVYSMTQNSAIGDLIPGYSQDFWNEARFQDGIRNAAESCTYIESENKFILSTGVWPTGRHGSNRVSQTPTAFEYE